ncbi:MAG TPA: hypothetical protein VEB43_18075 [Anaeromyxobacter sp.]|nr:hypothetical protein [Anaeromyxobacter sp.]
MRRLLLATLAGLALAPAPQPAPGGGRAVDAPPRDPAGFTALGAVVLFAATTPPEGRELWRTEATGADARLVADLVPGLAGSDPGPFAARGDRGYFAAGEGNRRRLWVTDGTAAGTAPAGLFPEEGLLDFSLLDAVPGVLSAVTSASELWQSDGTAPATLVLSRAERCRGSACGFAVLRAHAGALWAVSYAKSGPNELWRVDAAGRAAKLLEGFGRFVGEVASGLVFTGESGPLWLADERGARALGAVDAQFGGSGDSAALGGALLFAGRDGAGVELWRTDGTAEGTRRVVELAPGPEGGEPFSFVAAGDLVFFVARDGAEQALFATDGTAGGTRRLLGGVDTFARPVALGGVVLFCADDGGGPGLWRSDGTRAGTALLARLQGPVPWLWRAGDAVWFGADGGDGLVPWRTDGTSRGTGPVAGAAPAGAGAGSGGCAAGTPGATSAGWLAALWIASSWPRPRRGIVFSERLEWPVNGRFHVS